MYNLYTQEEINFIRENWKKMSNFEMANVLTRHSEVAIGAKRWKLGLKKHSQKLNFDDINHLFKQGFSVYEIAKKLGCARSSVVYHLQKHGIYPPYPTKNIQQIYRIKGEQMLELYCRCTNQIAKQYPYNHLYDYRINDSIDVNVKFSSNCCYPIIAATQLDRMKTGDEFWIFMENDPHLYRLRLSIYNLEDSYNYTSEFTVITE